MSSSRKCFSSLASSVGGEIEDIRITSGRCEDRAAGASSQECTTMTSASTRSRINSVNRRPRSGSGSSAMTRDVMGFICVSERGNV